MLTADDAENVRFGATKFRAGYEMEEVDDFVDRVVEQLRYYESGGRPDGPGDPGTRVDAAGPQGGEPLAPESDRDQSPG
ncbi:MAG: DivIVA domain-containing protein [Micrococcales bacterium]|nr:DivIVA domain-containing protein [Micrococcales bacterium]